MAAHRIPMRRIKYILSLRYEQNYSERRIAQQVGVGRSTVSRTLARVQQTGLTWSQCAALSDAELQQQLFPSDDKQQVPQRPLPDWEQVHKALAKHSYMTVRQLWLEYKAGHPDGLEYSQFCLRYRQWRGSDRHLEMRLEHRAGEKLFVDYSGKRPSIVDPRTGKSREVELFVATLGASHYTFVEATLTQQLKDVCGSLRRCFEFLGGTPRVLVPDNMKTAVTAINRGDVAKINATFQELADHYQVCVLPTRPGKPKDKAAVENAVLQAQRRILAPLRNRHFSSLQDLNAAIAPLLEALNAQPFQKKDGSRHSWFVDLDKPALRPLPRTPYRYGEWTSKRKVQFNYHVSIDKCYYSVPFKYAGKTVYALVHQDTVEIYLDRQDDTYIAAHRRGLLRGQHVTNQHHMPSHHQAYAAWTPERFVNWAAEVGTHTQALIQANFHRFDIPEQCFARCRSLLGLAKKHGARAMEAAAKEALDQQVFSYPAVKQIVEKIASAAGSQRPCVVEHNNIRGAAYYSNSSPKEEEECSPILP